MGEIDNFTCPDGFAQRVATVKEVFLDRAPVNAPVLAQLMQTLRFDKDDWSGESFINFASQLRCRDAQQLPPPAALSSTLKQNVLDESTIQDNMIYANETHTRYAIGRLVSELVGNMHREVFGSSPNASPDKPHARLRIYSGHDSTISPLLSALNRDNRKTWPPFASNVRVELWATDSDAKYRVKVVYDNRVAAETLHDMPFADFEAAMASKSLSFGDRQAMCGMKPFSSPDAPTGVHYPQAVIRSSEGLPLEMLGR